MVLFAEDPKLVFVLPAASSEETGAARGPQSLSSSESLLRPKFLCLSLPLRALRSENTSGEDEANKFLQVFYCSWVLISSLSPRLRVLGSISKIPASTSFWSASEASLCELIA